MKRLLFLSALILFIQACDQPVRTTVPVSSDFQPSPLSNDDNSGSDGNDDNIDPDIPTDDDNPYDLGYGFEECNLNPTYFKNNIGHFALCQNEYIETSFKLKMAASDTTNGTCFVPTHYVGENSFKLGSAQCVRQEANRVYDMTLTKERSEAITGVMVIKYSSLAPYMNCMNAKVNYMLTYGGGYGCQYDYYCNQAAENYAQGVCQQFVSQHNQYYLPVRFPEN